MKLSLDLDLVSCAPVGYNFLNDPQWLGRWEAGSLSDQVNGPFGALVPQGGSVTTTAGAVDGNPTWDFTKGSGISLVSANLLSSSNLYQGPITCIVVVQMTGSPAIGDRILDPGNAGGFGLAYLNGATLMAQDGTNGNIACTPTNFNCITWYSHSNASRTAIGNGAYSAYSGGVNGGFAGISLAANRTGTFPSSCRVAAVYLIEGYPNPALMAGLMAYLRTKFPSVVASATPPAAVSVDQVSRGALPAGPFDIIMVGGQSNNCCLATGTTPAAPAAGTYLLDHDNTIVAMKQVYDAATGNYLDAICRTSTALGGNATSLANTYQSATGRNVLIVPCANGGSSVSLGVGNNDWTPSWHRGFKLRNSLYGSTLARLKNAIALGGTFRFLWWYQGEQEAVAGVTGTFAADTAAVHNSLMSDAGVTKRVVLQTISDAVTGATAPNISAIQAIQTTLAQAGAVLIGPKNNNVGADGIHLNGTGCDQVGTAAANLALAQAPGTGWY